LENIDKRKWLVKNGRKRVLSEFTWDKIAEKTLQLYQQILKH
jgi:glycosyltransferase involved in cell wall biosynthesis